MRLERLMEKLKEKMQEEGFKEVDITNAKCEYCGKKVEACVVIGGTLTPDKEYLDKGWLFTYWSCKHHGAVGAIVNGELITKPSVLLNGKFIILDGEFYINLDFIAELLKKKEIVEFLKKLEKEIG